MLTFPYSHRLPGIAWLAVEINPVFFEVIGLGMGLQGPTVPVSVI